MEEQINNSAPEETDSSAHTAEKGSSMLLLFPVLLCIFLFAGFTQLKSDYKPSESDESSVEIKRHKEPDINFSALVSGDQFSKNLRDTVYTDRKLWLELRIDEQKLYVHYRDGHTKILLVSSGNKGLNKGIESRPGLFAIFYKEELHLSSQFDDAKMFYYMPFNMGIGFHSLAGTGYYGNLGVRPSSHGCIRMRTEDVKILFRECDVGTLVLAHRGATARIVAFAPEGFKNDREYTKDDYMNMLAYNLSAICEGNYFIDPPKRFIMDGAVIPKIGINVRSSEEIPDKQFLPTYISSYDNVDDRLDDSKYVRKGVTTDGPSADSELEIAQNESASNNDLGVSAETIKKYVYNPIGILPYFAPNKK